MGERLTRVAVVALLLLAACGPSAAPKRRLTVAFSGEEDGVIEPCGCSPAMLGGLARRAARLAASKEADVPMVYVAAGPLTSDAGEYDRLRGGTILRALGLLSCRVFVPTQRDLAAGLERGFDRAEKSGTRVLTGAPVHASAGREWLAQEDSRVVAVWSRSTEIVDNCRGIARIEDAALVVLSELDESTARRVAKSLSAPTLLLYAAGKTDPRDSDATSGSVAIAPYPAKGKYVGFAHLSGEGASATWTVEYKPVLHDFPEDERIVALKKAHQDEMRAADLVAKGATDARFTVGASQPAGRFVDDETCAACHAEAFKTWTASRHADAMTSLRKTGDDVDPACVRCHVVAYGTGRAFLDTKETQRFAHVGCESCHGPRGEHVDVRRDLKTDARRPAVVERDCMVCHDSEHDPTFDFATRWPRIAHSAK